MYYYEVAPNLIVRADSTTLTYCSDKPLQAGAVVTIPIGKKIVVGVVVKKVVQPSYPVKPVTSLVDEQPLPPAIVSLALWMSDYYATHLSLVLQTILPRGVAKTRRSRQTSSTPSKRARTNYLLTNYQSAALETINQMEAGITLLHGVTGSGKTQVYIEVAKTALAAGRSAIILVPEIALTSQLVAEFNNHFEQVLLTHSRQTEAERHQAWLAALHAEQPTVVIGPRSALFMPLENIGLIAIDEAHEPSFKQEQSPRYSTLEVAEQLAKLSGAKVIIGSATPSIVDYYHVEQIDRPVLELPTPARPNTQKPQVQVVDATKRANFLRHRFLSDALLTSIEQTLARDEQALIFHNRRGSSSVSLCENCGWQAGCPRCFIPLTLHADQHSLSCHICGLSAKVPTSCPTCQSADIIHKGIGTKLIESELRRLFPDKKIARFDADTSNKETVDQRYQELYDGEIDLIIGTQVIAKGLDLPHLRTVGIVQADAGLNLPDYSASERTFQLIAQVIGRVGRSDHPTTVVVQSYQPNHPAIQDGISGNYQDFYQRTLRLRQHTNFPPFAHLLKLVCIYKTEKACVNNARKLAATLRQVADTSVEILGPTPAFYERMRDTYRWQLVIKSPDRDKLICLLEHLPKTHWQFELDPISLL